MTRLATILDAQGEQLSLDDLLAVIEEEERGDGCEFECECYEAQGIEAWKMRRGQQVQVYRCGWIGAGTVFACPKRRKYQMDESGFPAVEDGAAVGEVAAVIF